jgi:hypothetical protein
VVGAKEKPGAVRRMRIGVEEAGEGVGGCRDRRVGCPRTSSGGTQKVCQGDAVRAKQSYCINYKNPT